MEKMKKKFKYEKINEYSMMRKKLIEYGFDLLQTKKVLKGMKNQEELFFVDKCTFIKTFNYYEIYNSTH